MVLDGSGKRFLTMALSVDFASLPSTADLSRYKDLLDMAEYFAANFNNADIMANGHVYSEKLTPQFIAPTLLSELVECGGR